MWGCSGWSRLAIAVREIGSPQRRMPHLDKNEVQDDRTIVQIRPLRVNGEKQTAFDSELEIPPA